MLTFAVGVSVIEGLFSWSWTIYSYGSVLLGTLLFDGYKGVGFFLSTFTLFNNYQFLLEVREHLQHQIISSLFVLDTLSF